jgi:16S rRNA processing protein RimM
MAVGRIIAPHGVKGQVRVEPLTDFPERFAHLNEVWLDLPSGERRPAAVESSSANAVRLWLKLKGVDNRDAAQAVRGAYILIPRTQAVELPEGHYFIDDIVGLEVVTVNGESLGTVREVLHTGANDVYVTDRAMIPATRQVVRHVDLGAGVMKVDLPEEI